jgi:hypothetical protein
MCCHPCRLKERTLYPCSTHDQLQLCHCLLKALIAPIACLEYLLEVSTHCVPRRFRAEDHATLSEWTAALDTLIGMAREAAKSERAKDKTDGVRVRGATDAREEAPVVLAHVGWMKKAGGSGNGFKRRFFTLTTDRRLSYFASSTDERSDFSTHDSSGAMYVIQNWFKVEGVDLDCY